MRKSPRVPVAAALIFALSSPVLARPIGGLWGATASFSFNTYNLGEFNREVFFLNARELFGSPLSALDPVRWGTGLGASFRHGITRRVFVEGSVERLEAKSVGGIFSLTQTVLVQLDASLLTGRAGILYAFPVKWGAHLNFGVMAVPVSLNGRFEVEDSLSTGSLTRFRASGVGVEFVVAEPEFFIPSQSLRLTFGYRQLTLSRVTNVETGEPLVRSLSPRDQSEDQLQIDYSGVFMRMGLVANFGKGK